jgi:hypothetical protein
MKGIWNFVRQHRDAAADRSAVDRGDQRLVEVSGL